MTEPRIDNLQELIDARARIDELTAELAATISGMRIAADEVNAALAAMQRERDEAREAREEIRGINVGLAQQLRVRDSEIRLERDVLAAQVAALRDAVSDLACGWPVELGDPGVTQLLADTAAAAEAYRQRVRAEAFEEAATIALRNAARSCTVQHSTCEEVIREVIRARVQEQP